MCVEKVLTTKEVAERLGITDSQVRYLILRGKLPAEKLGHIHMVKESDLEQVRERKVGRPPKAKVNDKLD